jgi:hypothetical protein
LIGEAPLGEARDHFAEDSIDESHR